MTRYLVVLLLAAIGCAPRPNADAERAAIMAADKAWLAAAQSGNIDSVLSFWTDDAHVIAPAQAPYVGRAAIRQMLVQSLQTPGFSVSWNTTEVFIAPSGDMAYSFGTNTFTVPGDAGRIDTLRGEGVVIWRKGGDGRWRSAVDTWTPSSP